MPIISFINSSYNFNLGFLHLVGVASVGSVATFGVVSVGSVTGPSVRSHVEILSIFIIGNDLLLKRFFSCTK